MPYRPPDFCNHMHIYSGNALHNYLLEVTIIIPFHAMLPIHCMLPHE